MQNCRKPDFLGIGAPRTGSSWLWLAMLEHPQIWMPPRKELHYFTRNEKYPTPGQLSKDYAWQRLFGRDQNCRKWKQELGKDVSRVLDGRMKWADVPWLVRYYFGTVNNDWYFSLFSAAPPGKVVGEITPDYGQLDWNDIQKLHALLPNVKIIYQMRNPVERSWSHLRFSLAKHGANINDLSIPELMDLLDQPSLQRSSDYVETLRRWRAVYPASQIHVLFYEQIEQTPQQLLAGLFQFLGVDDSFQVSEARLNSRINAARSKEMPAEIRRKLTEFHYPQVVELAPLVDGGYAEHWLEEFRSWLESA